MHDIHQAISGYADAYSGMEAIRARYPHLLPVGDQKTGVIAEFYAKLYADHRFGGHPVSFGGTSQSAWDLKVSHLDGSELKIQVKAVSAHARKSRISTIHPGWDELWLIRLDHRLFPEAFWTYRKQDHAWAGRKLLSRTMPRRGEHRSGSEILRNGKDDFDTMKAVILESMPAPEP